MDIIFIDIIIRNFFFEINEEKKIMYIYLINFDVR